MDHRIIERGEWNGPGGLMTSTVLWSTEQLVRSKETRNTSRRKENQTEETPINHLPINQQGEDRLNYIQFLFIFLLYWLACLPAVLGHTHS